MQIQEFITLMSLNKHKKARAEASAFLCDKAFSRFIAKHPRNGFHIKSFKHISEYDNWLKVSAVYQYFNFMRVK